MKHCIMVYAAGSFPEVDITEDEFNQFCKSSEILSAAMAMEEKYELIVSNFLDLEKEILTITAERMVRRDHDYSVYFDIRSLLNRRVANLLTSTRLYIDQIQQHIKVCDSELVEKVKGEFSKEYDERFEYRFMEALRNYVQHRGLAVHSTSHPSKRDMDNEPHLMEFKTKIYTKKDTIDGDEAFKKAVFNEMPEKVDLVSAAKSYVSAISRVHCFIRENTKSVVNNAREHFETTLDHYADLNNGQTVGLCAVKFEPNGRLKTIHKKISILLSWDDVRLELVNKNGSLGNLDKRYVSGNNLFK